MLIVEHTALFVYALSLAIVNNISRLGHPRVPVLANMMLHLICSYSFTRYCYCSLASVTIEIAVMGNILEPILNVRNILFIFMDQSLA